MYITIFGQYSLKNQKRQQPEYWQEDKMQSTFSTYWNRGWTYLLFPTWNFVNNDYIETIQWKEIFKIWYSFLDSVTYCNIFNSKHQTTLIAPSQVSRCWILMQLLWIFQQLNINYLELNFSQNLSNYKLNPLIPGANKKFTHAKTKYVWHFCYHQALKG